MKLQITTNQKDEIQGFNSFSLSDLHRVDSEVTDNECENIFISNNVLNSIPPPQIEPFFRLIQTKLRIGGTVTLSAIEPMVMSKMLVNNSLDEMQFSNIVASANSMLPLGAVKNILGSMNLQVLTTSINGISYEITARR